MHDSNLATSQGTEEASLLVQEMDCASCVAHVEKAARKLAGVEDARVNLALGRAVVRFDPSQVDANRIARAITDAGYPAAPETPGAAPGNVEDERLLRQQHHARAWLRRAIVGIILWFPVELAHWITTFAGAHAKPHGSAVGPTWIDWIALITSTIAIAYIGWAFYVGAYKALRRRTTDMDLLIAMGATVAYVYSVVALVGFVLGAWRTLPDLYFLESTGLLALISLGHWLEARARDAAGKSIRELLNLAPATALRIRQGEGEAPAEPGAPVDPGSAGASPSQFETVPVAELKIGDVVLVRPGDRVPIDGVVVAGRSSVDESMISGEPLPVTRGAGDTLIGGTQNLDGALQVRVTRVGSETALAQIIKLVEQAQSAKPAVQRLADRVAAVFVPSVLFIALVTGVGWYAWGTAHHWDSAAIWGRIALAVCSVLIIACPCALGLAVPAALMVGTGRGARMGILIRDVDALQNAERIDTVVLDKTGTLTRGKPVVARVETFDGMSENDLLRLAAAAEQYSEHPLAKAIVAAARERSLNLPDPEGFTNEPGYGVVAKIEGRTIVVGNAAMLTRHNSITGFQPVLLRSHGLETRDTDGTRVLVGRHDDNATVILGTIDIRDELKPDSAAAVQELHRLKLKTVLLTGDNRATAEAIARLVGIDDVRAEVKPDQKAAVIRELQREGKIWDELASKTTLTPRRRPAVAMVGDGINDAPALAQSDLGIAIGSGSDIAKETGDIVLVGGSLHGIATAIRLSRATMRTIRQNLFWAFAYNVIAIPLAALGVLSPLIAAAAMALSDVTVIGNALRLRRSKID